MRLTVELHTGSVVEEGYDIEVLVLVFKDLDTMQLLDGKSFQAAMSEWRHDHRDASKEDCAAALLDMVMDSFIDMLDEDNISMSALPPAKLDILDNHKYMMTALATIKDKYFHMH